MDLTDNTELLKVEHAWAINNIDLVETNLGEGIISPTFYADNGNYLRGRFILFPRGLDVDRPAVYASLYMQFESKTSVKPLKTVLEVSLLSVSNCREIGRFQCSGTIARGKGLGYENFVRRELLETGDTCSKGLIILCTVCLLVDWECKVEKPLGATSSSSFDQSGVIISKKHDGVSIEFSKKYETLYSVLFTKTTRDSSLRPKSYFNQFISNNVQDYNTNKCDKVILVCKNYKYRVNKNILMDQSPLLASKITDLKGSNEQLNRLLLDDLEPQVLREIVRFIYTGTIKNWKLGSELLNAANKYELEKLKNLCEQKLFNQMNLDNVFDILVLADEHKIHRLKFQALEIITLYAKWVVKTQGFELFVRSKKANLITEIFKALATVNYTSDLITGMTSYIESNQ